MRARPAPLQMLAAWLMAVALLVQLTATAACAAGGVVPPHHAFPICHASSLQTQGIATEKAPERQPTHAHDTCPFCSTCCHAAIALSPTTGAAAPVPVATRAEGGRPSSQPVAAVRLSPSASPRGPPTLA